MIVIGGVLATASNGATIEGMFWMMTVARGIVGFGTSPISLTHIVLSNHSQKEPEVNILPRQPQHQRLPMS
jgi:hypothetical protein